VGEITTRLVLESPGLGLRNGCGERVEDEEVGPVEERLAGCTTGISTAGIGLSLVSLEEGVEPSDEIEDACGRLVSLGPDLTAPPEPGLQGGVKVPPRLRREGPTDVAIGEGMIHRTLLRAGQGVVGTAGAGSSFGEILADIYRRLHDAYGPQHWWPADSALEVIVGAILTQNTTWHAVEKAIARIKGRRLLSITALHQTPIDKLAHLIRPAGYFRLKARRLKNLIDLLVGDYSGDLERMGGLPARELRDKLLAVNGIGPETADCILLYAFGRPVFVVDAYTLRVMSRHRLVPPKARYGELQGLFMRHLPPDAAVFNEYHALLVQVGKRHCRRTPSCPGCPLEALLP